MVRAVWLSIFGLGVLSWGACSDDTDTSGEGGGGATSSDGGAGATAATGGSGGDGGEATGGGGGGDTCIAFAEVCAATDVCCDAAGVTGECFAFGMGLRCTIPCPADPADCPNNGAGCNNQSPSYCKTN